MSCPDCEPLEEVALTLEAKTNYAQALQSAFQDQINADQKRLHQYRKQQKQWDVV